MVTHVLAADFPPGLRQKSLKSVRIPALFFLARQKTCCQSAHPDLIIASLTLCNPTLSWGNQFCYPEVKILDKE